MFSFDERTFDMTLDSAFLLVLFLMNYYDYFYFGHKFNCKVSSRGGLSSP